MYTFKPNFSCFGQKQHMNKTAEGPLCPEGTLLDSMLQNPLVSEGLRCFSVSQIRMGQL